MSGWDRVIGHDWAADLLRSSILNDRIGHAHLFTGPEQIGKRTLAITFAQAVNCLSGDHLSRPCGRCRSCKLIEVDRYPDVTLLSPKISGRGKRSIGIKQIRSLQQQLNLTATEARYKVAIITNIEAATINAANAFLKTLEEPPSRVILILTALRADTLLPTIPSRCRVINLRPLSRELISDALASRWNVPIPVASKLAHLAGGRIGWAVTAWNDPAILQSRKEHLELLYEGLVPTRVGRFSLAEKIVKKPDAIPDLLLTWLSWWRDIVLMKNDLQAHDSISNIDQVEEMESYSQKWSNADALRGLNQTKETLWHINRNANGRLAIENLLLSYPDLPG